MYLTEFLENICVLDCYLMTPAALSCTPTEERTLVSEVQCLGVVHVEGQDNFHFRYYRATRVLDAPF